MTLAARQTFASNLRREHKRLNLSQEALGFRCGLIMSEISHLETASAIPVATIVKLGNALGIPPAQHLGGIQ